MNKRIQSLLAGILAVLGAIALAGMFYVTYVFPKTGAVLAGQERALSITEQLLVNLSDLCKSFGILLIPALLVATIGCGVWAILAVRGNKEETTNHSKQT